MVDTEVQEREMAEPAEQADSELEDPKKTPKPGAEGGDSDAVDTPPGLPSDDDSALGDTDQHSNA